jgi:cell division protease FtsH
MMAKALMKYETIDHSQIKDIMDGREPQPPKDWDDTPEPETPDDGSATAESDEAAGTIGGPAQEH